MRKKIDFKNMTAKQIILIVVGFGLSVTGLVLSIILFASNLYTSEELNKISLADDSVQTVCDSCVIKPDQSLWLKVQNRQIEYTDISILVRVEALNRDLSKNEDTSFQIVNFRNQFGNHVYYRLMSLDEFEGLETRITLVRKGDDKMTNEASVALRQYDGMKFSFSYILMILIGVGTLVYGIRSKKNHV